MNITKEKQTHRERTSGYQWNKASGGGQDRSRELKDTNYNV